MRTLLSTCPPLVLLLIFALIAPATAGTPPDAGRLREFAGELWRHDGGEKGVAVAILEDFVRIPNLSPAFEPDWPASGHADDAAEFLAASVERLLKMWSERGIPTGDVKVELLGGRKNPVPGPNGVRRTPLLLVDVPAFRDPGNAGSVLVYGHMDKQPDMLPWSPGLAPRTPVLRDGKLYGRGAADDGYAVFSALASIAALREQGVPHGRVFIMIEGCEETGEEDVEYYLKTLRSRFGDVSLVVCMDTGGWDYEHLWITGSLRGIVAGLLEVGVLSQATHSGSASGMTPSPFRILRALLSRLEDEETGEMKPEFLKPPISDKTRALAAESAKAIGENLLADYPFLDGVRPVDPDHTELVLNMTRRPQLAVIGLSGTPEPAESSNVILPSARARLSIRIPPGVDAAKAAEQVKDLLEKNPPYGARVVFTADARVPGWSAPPMAGWLERAADEASRTFFGGGSLVMGEGGSIGFMAVFGDMYPEAQFLAIGALGPGSNAHAEDEALTIDTAAKLSMSVAHILAAHAAE